MPANETLHLRCPVDTAIYSVVFASLGDPTGDCSSFAPGPCHWNASAFVARLCSGKQECNRSGSSAHQVDACLESTLAKSLAVQVTCARVYQ